ncbi:hypothetical protein GN956_G7175 [Arapaima gigas]
MTSSPRPPCPTPFLPSPPPTLLPVVPRGPRRVRDSSPRPNTQHGDVLSGTGGGDRSLHRVTEAPAGQDTLVQVNNPVVRPRGAERRIPSSPHLYHEWIEVHS